jgi:uncharacterized protein (DUF486 family)
MTLAWYGHLKKDGSMDGKPLLWVIFGSWAIALIEYFFMVPANRIGYAAGLTLAQLKIIQEVISLFVFVPFAIHFMGEKWKMDYLWAFICILGAVFFVNREQLMS